MPVSTRSRLASTLSVSWPWLVLVLCVLPAFWHAFYFPSGRDQEFPKVDRPTFSAAPPHTYRLAEPGDTIDRVSLYASASAAALALLGGLLSLRNGRGFGLWPAALGLALAACWHSATPWPTFDGWHGMGWRVLFRSDVPSGLRMALAIAGLILAACVLIPLIRHRSRLRLLWQEAGGSRVQGLLIAALVLVLARQGVLPGVEPATYWPKWAFAWGMLAFAFALVRALPPRPIAWKPRLVFGLTTVCAATGLIAVCLEVAWYHRPLERLRAIEPGKIFISAMPDPKGLEVAHQRHGFRTIINLFQEDLPGLRHPLLDEELAFAKENGIRYLGSPLGAQYAEAFMDETLRLAQDPDAWPILVHCHGCMDRTPAWWGIYRFLHRGEPLEEIIKDIEQHRGSRPKASVYLLYNRVLAERAPERFQADPTMPILRQSVSGTPDPYFQRLQAEAREARTFEEMEDSLEAVETLAIDRRP